MHAYTPAVKEDIPVWSQTRQKLDETNASVAIIVTGSASRLDSTQQSGARLPLGNKQNPCYLLLWRLRSALSSGSAGFQTPSSPAEYVESALRRRLFSLLRTRKKNVTLFGSPLSSPLPLAALPLSPPRLCVPRVGGPIRYKLLNCRPLLHD